jgi:GNAT superfamily N-acetyltransferase
MTAAVRPARPEDAARLGEVHVLAWRWAYEGQMPADLLASLRPKSRAKAWKTWLTEGSTSDFTSWVVEVDGEIVGFTASSQARDEDVPDRCVELLMIYLLKENLGQGLGHLMIETAEAHWREQGYEVGILWVLESSHATRRFYERHGWVTDGAVRDQPVGDGDTRPVVRYTKLFD